MKKTMLMIKLMAIILMVSCGSVTYEKHYFNTDNTVKEKIDTTSIKYTVQKINEEAKQKPYDDPLPDSVYMIVIDAIKKYYDKQTKTYAKIYPHSKFVYEFVQASTFPLFLVSNVKSDFRNEFFIGNTFYNAYRYKDSYRREHMEVAVLLYSIGSSKKIYNKTYRLHYYLYNRYSSTWTADRNALDVQLKLVGDTIYLPN